MFGLIVLYNPDQDQRHKFHQKAHSLSLTLANPCYVEPSGFEVCLSWLGIQLGGTLYQDSPSGGADGDRPVVGQNRTG